MGTLSLVSPVISTEHTTAVSLLRKIKEAIAESNNHKFLHHQFVLGLLADSVKRWEEQLAEWEEDHSSQTPLRKCLRVCLQLINPAISSPHVAVTQDEAQK